MHPDASPAAHADPGRAGARPGSRLRAGLSIAAGIALFAALAMQVRAGPLSLDPPLAEALSGLAGSPLVRALDVVASVAVWSALVLASAALMWRAHRAAGILMLTALSGEIATAAAKMLVSRPRPSGPGLTEFIATASFPSGHVTRVVVGLGLLTVATGMVVPRWRGPMLAAATLVVAAVSIARIASGEHWPSDVLGGLLLGAIWLRLILLLARPWDQLLVGGGRGPSVRSVRIRS